MDVYSELKHAQLEHLVASPASHVRGRIFHIDAATPMVIDDGTSFHTVLTNKTIGISTSSGVYENDSGVEEDATNLQVTITTFGGPVEIYLTGGKIGVISATDAPAKGYLAIHRNGANISGTDYNLRSEVGPSSPAVIFVPSGSFRFIDEPAAGTYTYKVVTKALDSGFFYVVNTRLVAKEL